jgi:hypothetical protein
MKKILRLVTTSVLTLTLVACGEASSSVSNGTTTSSSVSSVSSAYANVTSVTLSAATATLTQVMGSLRAVDVTAALNANTDPNLKLEWFINGVKSNQSGRLLQFIPSATGAYQIQAKIGNLSSNTLTVNVGLPTLAITSSKFVEANQLELVASPGAVVSLVGAELEDSSYYDLKNSKYVLNLKKDLIQGATISVSLERVGFAKLTQQIVYDTRVFLLDEVNLTVPELATATELVAAGGVFKIVRPFDAGEQFNKKYAVSFEQENLSTAEYKTEVVVPTGATAIPSSSEILSAPTTKEFIVTSTTTLGVYTHKFTFGTKVVEVKVEVVDPKAEVNLTTSKVWVDQNYPVGGAFKSFELKFGSDNGAANSPAGIYATVNNALVFTPVSANADGSYSIVKPFDTFGEKEYMIEFGFSAKNFTKQEFINNQWNMSISGPSKLATTVGVLFNGIETATSNENAANMTAQTLKDFNGSSTTTGGAATTSAVSTVKQWIDSTTPVGKYTFTITAGTTGNLVTKDVVVNVEAPKPSLDFYLSSFESVAGGVTRVLEVEQTGNTYVIEKPNTATTTYNLKWFTTLMNYQSKLLGTGDFEEVTADNLLINTDNKKLFTATTGIATAASNYPAANILVKQGVTAQVIKATVTATTAGSVTIAADAAAGNLTLTAGTAVTFAANETKEIILGTVTTTAGATLGQSLNFTVTGPATTTILGGTVVNSTSATFAVEVSNYPDVVEFGSRDAAVAPATYRFVNVGLTATGPSNLFESVPQTRASVLLNNNTNGLVLFNQTGANLTQANAITGGAPAAAVGLNMAYLQTDADGSHLDPQDLFTDNLGFNRKVLGITNATVEGVYTLRFVVDNVVEEIKIQVVPSKPRLSVKSLWVDRAAGAGSVVNKFEALEGDLGNKFDKSVELIKIFDNDNATYDADDAADLFALGTNGVYTVETRPVATGGTPAAKDVLYGKLLVSGLSVASYNYQIRKEFPDGRVETYSDVVKVTSVDLNQVATFDSANAQFINNWTINQQYNPTEEGTYKFTFTVGTVTKSYTINIVTPPSLTVESLTISRKEQVLFNGYYRVLLADLAGAVRANISLDGLTEDDYFTVYASTLAGATLTGVPTSAITGNTNILAALVSLKNLDQVDLGTLTRTNTVNVVYTFSFYRKGVKVAESDLGYDLIATQTVRFAEGS